MRNSARGRWLLVAGAVVALTLAARLVDEVRLAGGFKGDEATYISMAFSVVDDHDLVYQRKDLDRFHELYGPDHGPEGLFLKRRAAVHLEWQAGWPPVRLTFTPLPDTDGLSYAKAFIYPLAAAPFVALGGLSGMLLFNVWLLLGATWCAARYAQARLGRPVVGAVLGVAFIWASSTPVWGAWLAPELFNAALVLFAYFLWRYKSVAPPGRTGWLYGPASDLAAAALLGVVTYSKASNALLVLPLLLWALWTRRVRAGLAIGAVFVAATLGLFAANAWITGSWNYQGGDYGGDRRTYYGHFPFEAPAVGYDAPNSNSMARDAMTVPTVDLYAPKVMLPLLARNIPYFLAGRDSGMLPYYLPGVVLLALWLWRWRRTSVWQVGVFGAWAASVLALLVITPYTWNGAGGPPGNRYFVSLYPVLLFLLPAQAGAWSAVTSAAAGLAFMAPLVTHPFELSHAPWLIPDRPPLHWLPIELTLINDVPARLTPTRGRIPFGEHPRVLLFYLDDQAYPPEGDWFWIAGGGPADIVIRSAVPLVNVQLTVSSPVDNVFTARMGGPGCTVDLKGGGPPETVEISAGEGVFADGAQVYALHLDASQSFVPSALDPASTDHRRLGVLVKPVFRGGGF